MVINDLRGKLPGVSQKRPPKLSLNIANTDIFLQKG